MEVLFTGRFTGCPRDAFAFFKNLASHNNREWFQGHKEISERTVRGPASIATCRESICFA